MDQFGAVTSSREKQHTNIVKIPGKFAYVIVYTAARCNNVKHGIMSSVFDWYAKHPNQGWELWGPPYFENLNATSGYTCQALISREPDKVHK